MTSRLFKFVNKLEDPKCPFLGPYVKWLKFWGLILPETTLKKFGYFAFYTLTALYVLAQYIDIWVVRNNIILIVENTKYTMLSTVFMNKLITFIIWQKNWISIIEFVTKVDLERHQSKDEFVNDTLKKSLKYCRILIYMYFFFWSSCVITITIVHPLVEYAITLSRGHKVEYLPIIRVWTPWDKTTLSGYLAYLAFTIPISCSGVCSMAAYDMIVFSILIFFICELKLLRQDSMLLFGSEESPITTGEAKLRLAKCHKRHNDLIKFARIFDKCLSPNMFLYVIVCSVMICSVAFQIKVETDTTQKYIAVVYLTFCVMQLFMYCWYSNEVFHASQVLSLGLYESIWWKRSISEQKNVHILIEQLNRPIIFTAGPFTNITVATFVSIMKGAYSYYAICNQSMEG